MVKTVLNMIMKSMFSSHKYRGFAKRGDGVRTLRIGRALATEERQPLVGTTVDQDQDTLIEFRDVYKSFGDKCILQGASFKIRRGEAVGIIGASGTGKSTTLRIAAGLLAPDSGEVLILGKPRKGLLSDSPEVEHLRVGMVFQNAALFDSLTVGENVGFLIYEHSVSEMLSLLPANVPCTGHPHGSM